MQLFNENRIGAPQQVGVLAPDLAEDAHPEAWSRKRVAGFYAVSNDLTAGTYQLSLLANAQERVESVPEPGSLALFGIAFVGMYGAWRMRRRASYRA